MLRKKMKPGEEKFIVDLPTKDFARMADKLGGVLTLSRHDALTIAKSGLGRIFVADIFGRYSIVQGSWPVPVEAACVEGEFCMGVVMLQGVEVIEHVSGILAGAVEATARKTGGLTSIKGRLASFQHYTI